MIGFIVTAISTTVSVAVKVVSIIGELGIALNGLELI